ncbi:MAG: cation:proton antiporter, partial [Bacteroidota bacterium]
MIASFGMFFLMGYAWKVALTISMAVALSSTAIVLQTLKEKGLMNTTFGASSFSILLFQDIIVIFMLGALPLFASEVHGPATDDHGHTNLLEDLPLWLNTIAIITSVALVVLAGRYVFVPMLRLVARTGVRELLIASALLIVLSIAYLMELVGLSPALGAFLGGVVLATSEFKFELESTLEPFKDLLLGLFFMAVGASINFLVIAEAPLLITGVVLGIIVLKALVLYIVGTVVKLKIDQRLLLTVALAQIGEFAFVLLTFAFQLNILDKAQLDMMLVVTALTMTLTPILAILNERLVLPKVGVKESEDRPMDTIEHKHKVLLIGSGHFGNTVGRFLRAHGVYATILDNNSNWVDRLRRIGFEVYYGDATRVDLLESAGIEEADIVISAIDDPATTMKLVKIIRERYPHVKLMVRSKNRYEAYDLLNVGVERVYRESLDTSVKLASDVLSELGFRKYTLHRQAQKFIKSDEEGLRRLASQPRQEEAYLFKAREEIAAQEKLMEADWQTSLFENDHQWDSEQRQMVE